MQTLFALERPLRMTAAENLTLEQCIALKLMLDIRFFDTGNGPQPVLQLPPALATGLAALQPGGIILFRENLASVGQITGLTAQIRQCLSPEALIAVDQEGGRVTRLPRDQVTSFSGNMALAACPADERMPLARAMGAAQGEELSALGINVNFAPTLDVNSNPQNPVINVRAFSDDPALVAALGAEVVGGLQSAGVAAAVKHFPGHGDTSLDSHTHLPCILRDRQSAESVDLAPFAEVISTASPAMVMTAHIQYPALDADTLPDTDIVRPATLSRRIITGLLRERLHFSGVVISDALDMRAISELISPQRAVIECFRAGVDIALMPLLLRDESSLQQLQDILSAAADAVRAGELDELQLRLSAQRILALRSAHSCAATQSAALERIGCEAHLALQQRIAEHSITLVHGVEPALVPGSLVHLLMPCEDSARALSAALLDRDASLRISWQALDDFNMERERDYIAAAATYLVAVNEPAMSAVELGGAEDLGELPDQSPATVQQWLLAKAGDRQRIVLMLGSPYRAGQFASVADSILASYDGAPAGYRGDPGPAYQALAAVLTGEVKVIGQLPVSMDGV